MSYEYPPYVRELVQGEWDLTPTNLGPALRAAFGTAWQLRCQAAVVIVIFKDDDNTPTQAAVDVVVAACKAAFDPLAMLKTKRKVEVDQVTQVFIENLEDLTSGISLKTQIDAAVDVAAVNAIVDSRSLGDEPPNAELMSALDRGAVHDYGDVAGAVAIDMRLGLDQKITLTGSLSEDDISIVVSSGPRKVTLEVMQGGAGAFGIPANAWPAIAKFGTKGAPSFGEAAGKQRFLVLDFRGGSVVYIHYDINVFG